MLLRLTLVLALWLTIWPAPGAPVASTKPKKEASTTGKKKAKKEIATAEKAKVVTPDSHKVKRGETLWGIARVHGVSVGDIMDLNHLSDSTLRDGQVLKIPGPASDPPRAPEKATTHTIVKGETFRSIARKYGLTQEDLELANPKTDPAAPQAGSKLTIPATMSVAENTPPDAGEPKPPETTHTVNDNDTYTTIAKEYGITVDAIAAANPDVNPARLRPGSKLNLPERPAGARKDVEDSAPAAGKDPAVAATARKTGANPDATAANAKSPTDEKPKPKPATRRYIVSADETPQTISEAFNISVARLYEMNDLKPGSSMKSGMEIRVPSSPGQAP